jgi:hypothetical protein
MSRMLAFAIMIALVLASVACAQGLGTISFPGLGSLGENVTVEPFVQAGFQRVGSNMNLPVAAEGTIAGLLQIDELDISMKDANFWTGTVGGTIKAGKLISLFASAGGSLNRTFIVSGEIPISLGQFGRQPTVDFKASQMTMWYAQGGVGLGPLLLGLYGDHYGIEVGEPRIGSTPLANQTLRADVITTTFAPYIGFALPASNGLLMVLYSPLAQSNTTLALRTSSSNLAQLQYTWNKPGNLISCNFQYNIEPTKDSSLGLWAGYLYMSIRGNAQLDYQNSTLGISRQRDVTATMTKDVIQGGVMMGFTF